MRMGSHQLFGGDFLRIIDLGSNHLDYQIFFSNQTSWQSVLPSDQYRANALICHLAGDLPSGRLPGASLDGSRHDLRKPLFKGIGFHLAKSTQGMVGYHFTV